MPQMRLPIKHQRFQQAVEGLKLSRNTQPLSFFDALYKAACKDIDFEVWALSLNDVLLQFATASSDYVLSNTTCYISEKRASLIVYDSFCSVLVPKSSTIGLSEQFFLKIGYTA